MVGGIKLAGDQTRNEAAEGRADLVAAGGEPLAGQQDDAGLHAGERLRNLDEVDIAERAALLLGLVAPGDAEQVERIEVPKTDALQAFLDLIGDQGRVAHLRKRRDDDAFFARSVDAALQIVAVDGQIDHFFAPIQNEIFV